MIGLLCACASLMATGVAFGFGEGADRCTIIAAQDAEPERMNCPVGFHWERMSGQCCVQDRETLPANGKIGYTGNSLCEDGFVGEYEQRPTTDGLGPPGCPNYTSYAFLTACRVPGESPTTVAPPTPPSGVGQPGTGMLNTIAGALANGVSSIPSGGTMAVTGVVGGLVGILLGTVVLGSPLPPGTDLAQVQQQARFWDEARRVDLENQRIEASKLYWKLGDLLGDLRAAIEAGDAASLGEIAKEILGIMVDAAGFPGMGDMSEAVFGSASVGIGAHGWLQPWIDSSENLDLDAIRNNPDRFFEDISFQRGRLAGEMMDLNRQIEEVMNPPDRPDFSKSPDTLSTDEAERELARTRKYLNELEAQRDSWDGTAGPNQSTGPSLKDLNDRQDQLLKHMTNLNRWMQDLPTGEQELQQFIDSASYVEKVGSLVGSSGTLASIGGMVGVGSPLGTAAISGAAGGYGLSKALMDYWNSAELAERRAVMRKMLGNAQYLSGVIRHQIDQGHLAGDATTELIEKARTHAASLKAQIGSPKK